MNVIKIIGIAAGIAVAGLAGLAITNPGNSAETSDDAPNSNLKTRHYQVDLKTFVEETEKIIPNLTTYGQNWKFIGGGGGGGGEEVGNKENQEGSATILVEVPVALFTDDLEISAVKKVSNDEIQVNIRSKSRVGQSDLGENKRHILQLLKALDEKFGN